MINLTHASREGEIDINSGDENEQLMMKIVSENHIHSFICYNIEIST